jgi:hypothetical protein
LIKLTIEPPQAVDGEEPTRRLKVKKRKRKKNPNALAKLSSIENMDMLNIKKLKKM